MESSIVIKVKLGDTLRRFNALIYENEQLEFDMEALRMKILGLFDLPTDVDMTLTYTDVDGDLVNLVDDDDLFDVMRQCLNPFRINVLVNNNKSSGSRSFTRPSGSSTPIRSPRAQQQLPNVTTGVSEVLNAVSEPICEAISKMSLEVASSAPHLAELVEIFSKFGQSYLFPGAQSRDGAGQNVVSLSNRDMSFTKDTNSSKGGDIPEVVPNATFLDLTSNSSQKVDIENDSQKVAAPVTPALASVDFNLEIPGEPISSGNTTMNLVPAACNVHNIDNQKETGEGSNGHFRGMHGSIGVTMGSADPMRRYCSGRSQPSKCPFSAMPSRDDFLKRLHKCKEEMPSRDEFLRRLQCSEEMSGIIHSGVQCDGCGVNPITGSRFKSIVKENYDLCCNCFIEMGGNLADYIRMVRPANLSFWHPRSKGLRDSVQHPRVFPPAPYPFTVGLKPARKLDSRFILDVNVKDGTMLAPSTPFSKIWRMRNNGSLVWPRGTQLVWIGGDKLCNAVSLEIEVPANGVRVEQELDIAVDFVAPEQPGRYISYWMMASPTGQKFGQRVWVLIQVDASLKDSFCDSVHSLNLNLPPVSLGSKGPIIIDVNVEPIVDCSPLDPPNSNTIAESVEAVVGEQPSQDREENFPINDNLLVGGVSQPVSTVPLVSSSISYPIIDMSDAVPPVPAQASSRAVDVQLPASSTENVDENNVIEQTLLKELEDMGFKQVDLNKEILRINKYNLEQSVDDLCGADEWWDPILEELDEMGFYDRAKNKQLLKKNNGSIKRVVMDLIAGKE